MNKKRIGILVGSLRKESYNKKIARHIISTSHSNDIEMIDISIAELPLYNEDLDIKGNEPQAWINFRNQTKTMEGFLFLTPEYNRGVPAALKNALDVGSRPYGQSVWDGKAGSIISVSPGRLSGFGANHQLRQSMVFLNVLMLQQPEAYIGDVASIFDAQGNITDQSSIDFLNDFINNFINWVSLISDKH